MTENRLAVAEAEVRRNQPTTSADWEPWTLDCRTAYTIPFAWNRTLRKLYVSKSHLMAMSVDAVKQNVRCAMAHAVLATMQHDGLFKAYVEELGALHVGGPCSACAMNRVKRNSVVKWRRRCPKAGCKAGSVVVRHRRMELCKLCSTPFTYTAVGPPVLVSNDPPRRQPESKVALPVAASLLDAASLSSRASGSGAAGSGSSSASALECPVCMEVYSKTPACVLRCGHMLCLACLGTIKKQPAGCKCPVCNAAYTRGDERRVYL